MKLCNCLIVHKHIIFISGEDQNHVVPTCGFDKRTWNTRKFQASIYDLGGGRSIRGIWSHYFAEVKI
jgi:ADP-ribosylation factor-like protein 13B